MNYSQEKMYEALHILVGPGDLKNRLIDACNHVFVYAKESDFSEDLRERFCALRKKLTSQKKSGDKGAFRMTIEEMTSEEASVCAGEILSIYFHMSKD